MNPRHILFIAAAGLAALPAISHAAEPNITGTYMLQSRDLPDGSKHTPPAVAGLLTYTRDYRNFNVTWINPDDSRTSIAYIAKYRLTDSAYQETPISWLSNNLGGEGISNEVPANKGDANPVTIKDGNISFPVAGEPPVLVFTADGMTATAKDADGKLMFVDHWVKVE